MTVDERSYVRELPPQHLQIEAPLGAVVVVARGDVRAGARGDVADRGGMKAAPREQLGGRVEQALRRAVAVAEPADAGHQV